MREPSFRLLALSAVLALPAAAADVGRFPAGSGTPPAPWELVRFSEKVPATRYQLRRWDGVNAVEARAEASMALLARRVDIDLQQTPVLCWRWRIEQPVQRADLRTKGGDDYAARVYVTFRLPTEALSLGLRAKLALARSVRGDAVPDAALNYVWDNRHPIGTSAPNAYTDRARMLVLRSGAAEAGRWVEERRDIARDLADAFGEWTGTRTTLLAVASDTDNTGETAMAGFADLHFVGRKDDCRFDAADTGAP
jgi:hypothetical protein